MTKPIIIAICGKSATGKTSLAHQLEQTLQLKGVSVHRIISDTTRPPREGEKNGVDYNFISEEEFDRNLLNGKYLEWTRFREWLYATNYDSLNVNKDSINIGIFNAKGIASLVKYRRKFVVIPVYLKEALGVRLRRSYRREHKWRLEYFRRAFFDWRDFKHINNTLKFFKYYLVFCFKESIAEKVDDIIFWLKYNHLFPGQKSII